MEQEIFKYILKGSEGILKIEDVPHISIYVTLETVDNKWEVNFRKNLLTDQIIVDNNYNVFLEKFKNIIGHNEDIYWKGVYFLDTTTKNIYNQILSIDTNCWKIKTFKM